VLDALGAPALPNADGRSFLAAARDGAAPWRDEVFAEYCTDPTPSWTGGMAVRQRMIRTERWKLCWYQGYRPQLFDLLADPLEMNDLGESSGHVAVIDDLTARLLAEWDPEKIDRIMRAREADKVLISAWGRATDPPETHRWEIRPEHNYLGLPGGPEAHA
jgi:choline-sulfatase